MEHIISFLPGQLPDAKRFSISLIGITFPDRGYHIQREKSDIYCLEYVIQGQGHVCCNAQTFHPQAGDVYLLPKGSRHSYHSAPQAPFEKIWMNVTGSICDSLYRDYELEGAYHFPGCRAAYPLFRQLLALCEAYDGNGGEIIRTGTLVFHQILQLLHAGRVRRALPEGGIARQAKAYMDLRVYEKLNVPQMAKDIGISASQLTRLFKKEYHTGPYRYFLQSKLQAACILLRNTSLAVNEISDKLQFADEHYFSAIFKSKMAVSPQTYRRKTGQGPDA